MELHGRHPKTATREFLQRYAGRDLTLDDCNYETEQGEEGFRTKLYVPVWSDQIFQGQWCDSLKEAEVSAARCFVEDPEVVATASTLPAPISIIKHWTKVYKKKGRGPVSGAEINHESRRQYNDQRNHGCRMAAAPKTTDWTQPPKIVSSKGLQSKSTSTRVNALPGTASIMISDGDTRKCVYFTVVLRKAGSADAAQEGHT
eukprot:symbB.v1.2.021207.t1/scaffold1822.1/size99790/2